MPKARLLASWQPEHTSDVTKPVGPAGPTMTLLAICGGMLLGITGGAPGTSGLTATGALALAESAVGKVHYPCVQRSAD